MSLFLIGYRIESLWSGAFPEAEGTPIYSDDYTDKCFNFKSGNNTELYQKKLGETCMGGFCNQLCNDSLPARAPSQSRNTPVYCPRTCTKELDATLSVFL